MAEWHISPGNLRVLAKFIRLMTFGEKKENRLKFAVVQQAEADDNAMKLILTSGEL
jgi:hypothetical protein